MFKHTEREEKLFQIGVYEIAQAIWMSDNGSSDRLDKDTEREYIAYLNERLAEWSPSVSRTERKDNAVRDMIVAVLDEHKRRAIVLRELEHERKRNEIEFGCRYRKTP